MQSVRGLLLLALLVVPAAAVSSLSSARVWLRSHGAPSGDELAELKSANPEAYAIVKALLMKKSLGLLDPKNPTASFSKAKTEETVDRSPEAFAKFASPGELDQQEAQKKVAMPYGEVQPAAHHDWLNWKPQQSANDDDAMVANVLGAVAELKGKKAPSQAEENPLAAAAAEENAFAAQPVAVKRVAAVAVKKASAYMDFSMMTGEAPADAEQQPAQEAAPAAKIVKENSYLRGLNLDGDAPVAAAAQVAAPVQKTAPNSYLAGFSWSDDKPAPKPKPAAAMVETKHSNLLSWLGVEKKAPAPKVEAPAKAVNPYILDLN